MKTIIQKLKNMYRRIKNKYVRYQYLRGKMGIKFFRKRDKRFVTSYDFDSGNLGYAYYEKGDYIRVKPRATGYPFWWYGFSTDDLEGKTPIFRIQKSGYWQWWKSIFKYACYSTALDSDDWVSFDGTPTIGDTYAEIACKNPLPSGTLYFAHMPAYPLLRVTRKVTEWLKSPYVSDTSSGTNGIIGYATERDNIYDGRINPAQPFYALKITNPVSKNIKNIAILTSGNHPGETIARFLFEGTIDYLLGDTDEASTLRDWFEFYVYPCVCPQGVWGGYQRSCPDAPTLDHNREWNSTGRIEDIDAFKAAMMADAGNAIHLGIDFHCSNSQAENNYGIKLVADGRSSVEAGAETTFVNQMKTYPNNSNYYLDSSEDEGMLPHLWRTKHNVGNNIVICITTEIVNRLDVNVSDYLLNGEHIAKSIHKVLVDGHFPNYGNWKR